eukprot:Plantae.Rhodophyta-Hildenbrandia_rubra.ctg1494.p1 GENE.Plantae.Rhodophyta-Hildenbrandia_rubra.ctg1494~~Plantae.Rhodophyta-Hildenbrandia_rubra.ctg1494.p1  ORF type:complete len:439 (-),score=67.60 Plantae.Rhodophyta-Hildenbrandia_rubra.ctg1494:101-1417(-)
MSSAGTTPSSTGATPSSRTFKPLPRNPYDMLSRPPSSSSLNGGPARSERTSGVLSKATKRAVLQKPKSAFLCEPVYQIPLPEPPADLKCLEVALDCSAYAKCTVSELERRHRPNLLSDPFHGIRMNLLDQSLYSKRSRADTLTPEDEALVGSQRGTGSRFSGKASASPGVSGRKPIMTSYLRRMTYDEYDDTKRATVGRVAAKSRRTQAAPKTREEKLQAIENGFNAAKKTPVHPTKRHLKPVNIAPLVPDFASMCNNNMLVRFDAPPLARHNMYKRDREMEKKAMNTAFTVAHVAPDAADTSKTTRIFKYYLPSADTLKARKRKKEDSTGDIAEKYEVLRDYEFQNRQRRDDKDLASTYILAVGDKEKLIRYSELGTTSILKKRPPNQPTYGESALLLERGELSSVEREKRRKLVHSAVQRFSKSDVAAMASALEED